jgi:predicted Zn-dependent peptidase
MMKRSIVSSALGAALAVSAASAQTLDRSKRPAAPPAPVYKMPAVTSQTLPNGLVVRVMENHALPLVSARVTIEGGSLLDPAGREGMFTLDTALVKDGPTTMSAEQFADALAGLGGVVTATRITNLSSSFERCLMLMGDMLMHPSFAPDVFARRKAAYAASLQRSEDSARVQATRVLNATLWGPSHPFARTATSKSIAAITRDELLAFHQAMVQPQHITLTIVGDVTPASAMAAVTKVFGGWQKTGERGKVAAAAPPAPKPTTIYLYDRPNSQQTTIQIGQPLPARSTGDFYALETMGALFGGPTGSRLSQSMRERRPLTYGVTHIATWRGLGDPGSFVGTTNVDAMKTDSAIVVWLGEIKNLASGKPTDAELAFGRAATVGTLLTRVETLDQMATQLSALARDGLALSYYDDYVKGMNAVTAASVAAAAARHVDPSHLTIVVVGDRKTVEPVLRAANIAPVVVVDQDGKPLP